MADATDQTLHGTVVAAGGRGALLRGPSGAGKSDLALRCLALHPTTLLPAAVELVADDRVLVETRTGRLVARAPAILQGLIEVRGVGILRVPFRAEAELRLVVDLVPAGEVERLPPEPLPRVEVAGGTLPRLHLDAREPSAPLKLLLALARV